jgi:hypothetical protein
MRYLPYLGSTIDWVCGSSPSALSVTLVASGPALAEGGGPFICRARATTKFAESDNGMKRPTYVRPTQPMIDRRLLRLQN